MQDQKEKYIYYLLALSVSSIAFSIFSTKDDCISINHIPIGLSVLLWAISIFFGLVVLRLDMKSVYDNFIVAKRDTNYMYEDDINRDTMTILSDMSKRYRQSECYFKIQTFTFYFGVVSFIVWHIIQMAGN